MGVRYIGVTDEETTCGQCGRVDLARTVVVEFTDADGNGTGEIGYFGSTCAARALNPHLGTRYTGREILARATVERSRTLGEATTAADLLTHYGLPLVREPNNAEILAAIPAYRDAHALAAWVRPDTSWESLVRSMIVARQAQVADGILIGWRAPVAV